MKYIQIDNQGLPLGFYSDDTHGARLIADPDHVLESIEDVAPLIDNADTLIPVDAVEITDEQWQEFIDNPNTRKWNSVTQSVEAYEAPFDLLKSKDIKCREIRTAFNESVNQAIIDGSGVLWDAGYDSALKLDAAKRMAELAGLTSVVFYDALNAAHTLALSEASNVILLIGSNYQDKFTRFRCYFDFILVLY